MALDGRFVRVAIGAIGRQIHRLEQRLWICVHPQPSLCVKPMIRLRICRFQPQQMALSTFIPLLHCCTRVPLEDADLMPDSLINRLILWALACETQVKQNYVVDCQDRAVNELTWRSIMMRTQEWYVLKTLACAKKVSQKVPLRRSSGTDSMHLESSPE